MDKRYDWLNLSYDLKKWSEEEFRKGNIDKSWRINCVRANIILRHAKSRKLV